MDPHEQSDRDFSRARRRAFLRRIGAYLRRDPGSNQLLSFDEVKGALGAISQVYLGLREVPVSKIVGSVGRHRDFDRAFLPSKPDLGTRWRRIDEIMHRDEELPPVSLYKIGDAYFVQDGNHRVSVARQQGVALPPELLDIALAMDVKFIPCQMSLDMLGIRRDQLIDGVEEPAGRPRVATLEERPDSAGQGAG